MAHSSRSEPVTARDERATALSSPKGQQSIVQGVKRRGWRTNIAGDTGLGESGDGRGVRLTLSAGAEGIHRGWFSERIQRNDAKAQRRQGEREQASKGELREREAFLPRSLRNFATLRLGVLFLFPHTEVPMSV